MGDRKAGNAPKIPGLKINKKLEEYPSSPGDFINKARKKKLVQPQTSYTVRKGYNKQVYEKKAGDTNKKNESTDLTKGFSTDRELITDPLSGRDMLPEEISKNFLDIKIPGAINKSSKKISMVHAIFGSNFIDCSTENLRKMEKNIKELKKQEKALRKQSDSYETSDEETSGEETSDDEADVKPPTPSQSMMAVNAMETIQEIDESDNQEEPSSDNQHTMTKSQGRTKSVSDSDSDLDSDNEDDDSTDTESSTGNTWMNEPNAVKNAEPVKLALQPQPEQPKVAEQQPEQLGQLTLQSQAQPDSPQMAMKKDSMYFKTMTKSELNRPIPGLNESSIMTPEVLSKDAADREALAKATQNFKATIMLSAKKQIASQLLDGIDLSEELMRFQLGRDTLPEETELLEFEFICKKQDVLKSVLPNLKARLISEMKFYWPKMISEGMVPEQFLNTTSPEKLLNWDNEKDVNDLLESSFIEATQKFSSHLKIENGDRSCKIGNKEWHFPKQIGQGGQGTIYLSVEPSGKPSIYAIKYFPPQSKELEKYIFDEAAVNFKLQGRSLNPPENKLTPTVYKIMTTSNGGLAILMEYMPFSDAERFFKETAKLAAKIPETNNSDSIKVKKEFARLFFGSVIFKTAGIHLMNVVHKDGKLANILFDENFSPRVADFGLAQTEEEAEVSLKNPAGTIDKMNPTDVGIGFYGAQVQKHDSFLLAKLAVEMMNMWDLGDLKIELSSVIEKLSREQNAVELPPEKDPNNPARTVDRSTPGDIVKSEEFTKLFDRSAPVEVIIKLKACMRALSLCKEGQPETVQAYLTEVREYLEMHDARMKLQAESESQSESQSESPPQV